MIPEDQSLPVGGVVCGAVLDKACQGRGLHHRVLAVVADEAGQTAVFDLVNLVDGVGDPVDLPLLAAAGIDDDVDVAAKLGLCHLLQVVGCHAGLGFQIRAAHIDHDRKGIAAVAVDLGVLFPSPAGDGLIELAGVGGSGPAGGDGAAAGEAAEQAGQIKAGGRRGRRRRRGRGTAAEKSAESADQIEAGAGGAAALGAAAGAATRQEIETGAEDAAASAGFQEEEQHDDNENGASADAARQGAVAGTAGVTRSAALRTVGIAHVLAHGFSCVQAFALLMDPVGLADDIFSTAIRIVIHEIILL